MWVYTTARTVADNTPDVAMAHFKNPSLQIGRELHELQCALAAVLSLPVVCHGNGFWEWPRWPPGAPRNHGGLLHG